MKIHKPKNKEEINEVYGYLSVDKDGTNGIMGIPLHEGVPPSPMLFGDKENADLFKGVMIDIGKHLNQRIELVKFTNKEVIEVISEAEVKQ